MSPQAVMPREDLDPDGGTATIAAQPVGTIGQLSGYLVNGYWAWSGTIAHHWTSNTITYNLGNLDPSEQDLALAALAGWSAVANIAFVQAEAANIIFDHNGNMTAFTSGTWTGSGQMTSATVNISSNWITSDGGANDGRTGVYSYGFQTYIHELGHALGLGHQGPYNGSATYGTDNIYANDSWQLSVMSYFPQPYYNGGSYDYVVTPQMADIAAVQSIYGASSTRTGNTVYGFNSNAGPIYDFSQYTGLGTPALTIYDSGGSDTLDCSGYSQNQILDLTPGAFCSVGGYIHNIGVFSTTLIEAAIGGSGSDTIIGNSADNELIGGIGNDTLAGQGGNDIIDGGPGTDTVVYSGIRSEYQITQNSNGSFQIFDLRPGAPEGTVDAWNVEFFQFADRAVSTSDVLDHPPSSEPDLLGFLTTGDAMVAAGGNLTIDEYTFNVGLAAAPASITGFYLSTDTTIATSDIFLTLKATPSLAAYLASGFYDHQSFLVALPDNLAPGTYYLGALADSQNQITESNEGNNALNTVKVTVTPPPQPDLLGYLAMADVTAAAGGNLAIDGYTFNVGTATALASSTAFYLSTDPIITTSDIFLTSKGTPSLSAYLAAGCYDHQNFSVALPGNLAAGTYYLGALADYQNQISESNEGNNAFNTIKVTVTSPTFTALSAAMAVQVFTESTSGNGFMTGTDFSDTFVFHSGFGNNAITNFELNNDAVQFDKSIFASVNDVLAHTTDTAAGAVIADGHGDTVTLIGITLAQLQSHQSDFQLV
jgi:hypothetical protein